MTDIEFSDWYFLFLTPSNNETGHAHTETDLKSSNKLTMAPRATTAKEVTESLSKKLNVPSSEFSIISIEEYRVRKKYLVLNLYFSFIQ